MSAARFLRNVMGSVFGSAQHRYESRHAVLSALAARAGLRMYNRHLVWFDDPEFLATWRGFPESTAAIMDRRFVMLSAVRAVAHLPGDTAECGSFRGAGSHLILAGQSADVPKPHHIFDSFEGLSQPDSRDDTSAKPTAFKWAKHDLAVGEQVVARNLAQFKDVHLYRGWIPTRFEQVADRRFSFVHIDVDLYQPTYDSIAFFFPRMVAGGIILCDDYGFTTCPGAKRAFDDFLKDKAEGAIHLTTGQALVVKQPDR